MKLEKKHAFVLLGISAWNVVTYIRFIKALIETPEDRPTGYYVAHSILIVVNLAIAVVLGKWGWRAYKESKQEPKQVSEPRNASV